MQRKELTTLILALAWIMVLFHVWVSYFKHIGLENERASKTTTLSIQRWTSPMGVECACISTYLLERQHPRLPHGWLKMSGSLGYPHLWDGWAIVVGCIGNPNVRKVTPSQCSIVNIIVTTCVSVQEINKHAISITNTREVYFSIHFCSGRLTFNPFMRVFHRIFANATQIGVMCKSNW